jgi:hypothetical protein
MTKRPERRQKVDIDQSSLAAATQAQSPPAGDATSSIAANLAKEQATKEKESDRKHKRRPSEARRVKRKVTATLSDSFYVDRLRQQAIVWQWFGPDGRRPNTSKIIEFLILHPYTLEDAEQGRVPEEIWTSWEPD